MNLRDRARRASGRGAPADQVDPVGAVEGRSEEQE